MQLALFTPGAYIWPVHRSFEAFIASLAAPATGAVRLADSPLYPALDQIDSAVHGWPGALDARLTELHRQLYEALLRPTEYYARERASFAQYFFADLAGTPLHALFSAFTFYFVRQHAAALSVVQGLSVLRAAFFSHESAEPRLWLHGCLKRLAAERAAWPSLALRFTAPRQVRVSDLAFALVADPARPLSSAAWSAGRLRREPDGLCHVSLEAGRDASLASAGALELAAPQIERELRASLARVFGWEEAAA